MENSRRELHYRNFKELLKDLGEDAGRDGLQKTPFRMVDSLEYLTSGYHEDVESVLKSALFDVDYQDMVIVRDIEVYSLCEHHVLPFYGNCHIGYIPRQKVVGLSKLPRVVDIFARRLQVQERLTHQIASAIQTVLNPIGVGVVVEASHLCMMMRGVGKQNSYTMTSSMQGSFQNLETRNEFLSLIRGARPQ
jgi:GTP cyclohydrolase I